VVVPAFNEERLIGRTVRELPAWVDHVIVVDDASRDQTSAQALATRRTGMQLVRHDHNRGVGAATVSGYRRALELDAALIVGSNGDAQMNPDDIPALLAALDAGADLVRGNRFARPQTIGRMPRARRLAIGALSALTRWATGVSSVSDSQSGYHALTANALRRLDLDALWPRYGFPNDLVARAAEAGLGVTEVGVDAIYGDERRGLRPWHALHPVSTVILAAAGRRLSQRLAAALTTRTDPR
jgi:glycosyltransferase involved in cell wall biosynthesis